MKTRAIAFILNQAKSEFYHAWGEGLVAEGTEVFYVSPSPRWTNFLLEKNVPRDSVLSVYEVCDAAERELTEYEVDALARLEAKGPLSLASMILMDRVLCDWSIKKARTYSASLALAIERFMAKNEIVTVFGETTWLIELLIAQVADVVGAQFYSPSTARIPSERLVFFNGASQTSYLKVKVAEQSHYIDAEKQLKYLLDKRPQPYYMGVRIKVSQRLYYLFREGVRHLVKPKETSGDVSVLPLSKRILSQLVRGWRSWSVEKFVRFEDPIPNQSNRYVYLTLHKQPEASVDVLGAPYTNQLENIRALARLLPVGCDLWVKEHLSAIGDRPVPWYRELKKIPGVRLIASQASGFSIMQSADLVISPSGTVSYEAGMLGVRSACFAPMYFSPVLLEPSTCPFSSSRGRFQALLTAEPASHSERVSFLADILANSFPGIIGDPVSDPDCMEPKNVDQLVQATLVVHQLHRVCESGLSSKPVV